MSWYNPVDDVESAYSGAKDAVSAVASDTKGALQWGIGSSVDLTKTAISAPFQIVGGVVQDAGHLGAQTLNAAGEVAGAGANVGGNLLTDFNNLLAKTGLVPQQQQGMSTQAIVLIGGGVLIVIVLLVVLLK